MQIPAPILKLLLNLAAPESAGQAESNPGHNARHQQRASRTRLPIPTSGWRVPGLGNPFTVRLWQSERAELAHPEWRRACRIATAARRGFGLCFNPVSQVSREMLRYTVN